MSIRVEPDMVERTAATFGSGTLIGYHTDLGVRIVTVDAVIESDGTMTITGVSGTLMDALAVDPRATIVWQPTVRHGWTLVVDGLARPTGSDAIVVETTSAMLHRPSSHSDGPAWEWPERDN